MSAIEIRTGFCDTSTTIDFCNVQLTSSKPNIVLAVSRKDLLHKKATWAQGTVLFEGVTLSPKYRHD